MRYGIVLLFLLLPVLSFCPPIVWFPLAWYYQIMPVIEKNHTAEITYYNAVEGQCDKTPDICADGTKIRNPRKQRIVAISKPLERELGVSFGDTIIVHSIKNPDINGIWVIHDRMNEKWKKRKIDFLLPHKTKFHKELINFKIRKRCGGGKKTNNRHRSQWASG